MKKLMMLKPCWISIFISIQFILSSQVRGVPKVVVSIKPLHSLVAGVMSGIGKPTLLIPGNVSPHTHALRPSQYRLLQKAELIFWIGHELETFLSKTLTSLQEPKLSVEMMKIKGVHLLKFISETPSFLSLDKYEHDRDPHIWLDPRNAQAMVQATGDALNRVDGINGEIYQQNAENLIRRLILLDSDLQKDFSKVKGRSYIVQHPAFNYLEKRYGLKRAGLVMISPERTPGARHLSILKKRIRDRDVQCLFIEPQFKPRMVEVLLEGTRVRTTVIDPMGYDLEEGSELYFTLLRQLSRSFHECLLD